MFFLTEDSYGIKPELRPEVDNQVPSPVPVISPIPRHEVAQDENAVVKSHDNCCNIVDSHSHIKPDQCIIHTGKMQRDTGEYEEQEHERIDHVPDPDPDRVEIYFYCGHTPLYQAGTVLPGDHKERIEGCSKR